MDFVWQHIGLTDENAFVTIAEICAAQCELAFSLDFYERTTGKPFGQTRILRQTLTWIRSHIQVKLRNWGIQTGY